MVVVVVVVAVLEVSVAFDVVAASGAFQAIKYD